MYEYNFPVAKIVETNFAFQCRICRAYSSEIKCSILQITPVTTRQYVKQTISGNLVATIYICLQLKFFQSV
jgi:hypothetical protein